MDQLQPDILHPVDRTRFHNEYLERQPLYIERSNPAYFQQLISIEEIEVLLSTGGQSFPDVQLVNAHADIPVGEYTDSDRRIIAPGLWRHYREGATIVVSGAERRFCSLSDLCRSVSADFGMRSQTNLYISP